MREVALLVIVFSVIICPPPLGAVPNVLILTLAPKLGHASESKAELDQHFTILLEFLAPNDPEEAGRLYLRLHEKLEGYFRLRGVADPVGCADEVLDRAARRIAEGTEVPEINRFCLGIARFILKEQWRIDTRESQAFLRFLEQNESITEDELNRLSLMRLCFDQLAQNDRELLNAYCAAPRGRARAEHRRNLAKARHSNVSAVRIRVTRLRRELDDCVREMAKASDKIHVINPESTHLN